jgi:hypothetical protein
MSQFGGVCANAKFDCANMRLIALTQCNLSVGAAISCDIARPSVPAPGATEGLQSLLHNDPTSAILGNGS